MKVHVQYTGQLRAIIGFPEEVVELTDGGTLADLLSYLPKQWDRAAQTHILTESGQTRLSLLLVVNGLAIPVADAGKTLLRSGDIVTLMPPIAGG